MALSLFTFNAAMFRNYLRYRRTVRAGFPKDGE